jgi:acetylornithine deacetylase/succinyl-diaminopimelate desuccinylase-like protein
MEQITRDRAGRILADLVSIPSVNPIGKPHEAPAPVERGVSLYLEELFRPYGAEITRQVVSPVHENLLVRIPGRESGPATLFESHMDTVPADDWADRAFTPRLEGDVLYGRGACDDKGCLTAMALAALDLLESGTLPPQPVLFLAAGDEEYAQTGIRHFLAGGESIGRGVFGEPTEHVPIIQHKGTVRWDITVRGRSAHTSRPELGRNAILDMLAVIQAIGEHQRALQERHVNPLMTGPTLTVTRIQGGRTRNAVPDECMVSLDFRILPGMEPAAAREELIGVLDRLGLDVLHHDVQLMTPPLATAPGEPFARQVLEVCRGTARTDMDLAGVPYGTDAAWLSAPAVVLGPGSIVSAHAIDEHVDLNEVVEAASIYRRIMLTDFARACGSV